MEQPTALDIAKYFITISAAAGVDITHQKLQYLLYYAQGWHLGLYGKPLFSEQIEAWDVGPVVPEVYKYFSNEHL